MFMRRMQPRKSASHVHNPLFTAGALSLCLERGTRSLKGAILTADILQQKHHFSPKGFNIFSINDRFSPASHCRDVARAL